MTLLSFQNFSPLLAGFAIFGILSCASAGASSGCGKSLPTGQTAGGKSVNQNLTTDDGTGRTYLIYIPTLYNPTTPAPLIINYHGRTQNAQDQERLTGMSNPNWNNASVVIYPNGLNEEWEGDPDVHGVDDIAFTQKLVSTTLAQYCIDPSRIYAVGSSNGGGFVGNYLACSDWGVANFAVFGAGYGAFYTNTSDTVCNAPATKGHASITAANVPISCNNTKQDVPMIEFHGTGDQTIPYNGGDRRGLCLPTVPHWVTNWATRTGLDSSNSSKSLFKDKTVKYEFGTGVKLGQVTHYEVIGMGHTWPTTAGNVAPFDATPVLMDFFAKWGPGDGKTVSTSNGTSPTSGSGSSATSTTKSSPAASASSTVHHSGALSISTMPRSFLIGIVTISVLMNA